MGNIAAIFWKEMRSYFGSPIAYVVATGFLLMMGYLLQNEVVEFRAKCLNYSFQHQEHGVDAPNVNEDVVFHFFLSQCLVWLVVTPMLTMRLFAEEKGSGTIELLMTSPLTTWQVILGKFAACLGLYVIIELLLLSLIFVVSFYGDLNWGRVLSACVAILLLGGSFISVGILASSLTDKQIVAVVIAFVLLLLLFVVRYSPELIGREWATVLFYLSLIDHTREMARGVIDSSDVIFFLTFTFFFLFLTHTALESRRWRR